MIVRPADSRDFDAIAAITNHYITTSTIHFGYEPVTADALRASVRPRHPWFVADDDRAVVGYAKAGAWRERAAYDWTTEIGLYVEHTARGRGIGRALYTALLAELARRGFRSVIAGITLPNDASVALHRAFGFVDAGVVREAGYKHGRWNDVAFFQKALVTGDATPPALL